MARVPRAARIRRRFPARLRALEALASGHVLDLATVGEVGSVGSHDRIRAAAPYDTIVSVGVLCELDEAVELDDSVRLLAQALAPDGRLLFAEPDAGSGPDVRAALWRNGLTVIDSRPWRRRSRLGALVDGTVIGGVARLTPARPAVGVGPTGRSRPRS